MLSITWWCLIDFLIIYILKCLITVKVNVCQSQVFTGLCFLVLTLFEYFFVVFG